ncbi:MAG: TadE/TadG family type IV pilus assembly protein [Bacilli bacterium]|nr:TadE/TadG family type IV pilus assembly protein [Bacilli bacterium]MDD4808477.1 TadE/TadG family type IV pilus assembly protein [Bacilli bacterium]
MNKKGQALVEFILILPIFVMFLLSMLDFANVIYRKYHLENDLDYIVDLYRQAKTTEINIYAQSEEIRVDYQVVGDKTTVILYKNVDIITPGASLIFDDPYTVEVKRVIYNE